MLHALRLSGLGWSSMSRLESIFFASVLFSPGKNQIVKVEVDWTAALDRRAGPPRWTTESQSKLQSFALDHQSAAAGELREVGGVLPARIPAAVAAPLYQYLANRRFQTPTWDSAKA
eukprot:COSAG03_NODE_9097_length_746_cov_1.119011_1_plen_117_part_00